MFSKLKRHIAVAFAYLEQLIQSPPDEREVKVTTSLSLLSSTRENIVNAGTQAIVVDDAFEEFEALINNIIVPNDQQRTLTLQRLLEIFQARATGNNYAVDDGKSEVLSALCSISDASMFKHRSPRTLCSTYDC